MLKKNINIEIDLKSDNIDIGEIELIMQIFSYEKAEFNFREMTNNSDGIENYTFEE